MIIIQIKCSGRYKSKWSDTDTQDSQAVCLHMDFHILFSLNLHPALADSAASYEYEYGKMILKGV